MCPVFELREEIKFFLEVKNKMSSAGASIRICGSKDVPI